MKYMIASVALIGALFGGRAAADELTTGQAAPDFVLPDQEGKAHRLSDYRGKWVVLYFYPKDDTPGCTQEACSFRDDIHRLRALGAQVLGVSVDDTLSHAAFAKKYGVPFPLLSDRDGQVAKQYGSIFGIGPLKVAKRHSFIVDPEGRVAKVYRKVDTARHAGEVVADVTRLAGRNESPPVRF